MGRDDIEGSRVKKGIIAIERGKTAVQCLTIALKNHRNNPQHRYKTLVRRQQGELPSGSAPSHREAFAQPGTREVVIDLIKRLPPAPSRNPLAPLDTSSPRAWRSQAASWTLAASFSCARWSFHAVASSSGMSATTSWTSRNRWVPLGFLSRAWRCTTRGRCADASSTV